MLSQFEELWRWVVAAPRRGGWMPTNCCGENFHWIWVEIEKWTESHHEVESRKCGYSESFLPRKTPAAIPIHKKFQKALNWSYCMTKYFCVWTQCAQNEKQPWSTQIERTRRGQTHRFSSGMYQHRLERSEWFSNWIYRKWVRWICALNIWPTFDENFQLATLSRTPADDMEWTLLMRQEFLTMDMWARRPSTSNPDGGDGKYLASTIEISKVDTGGLVRIGFKWTKRQPMSVPNAIKWLD